MEDYKYVHKETGRIVIDLNTLEEGESVEDYTVYNPEEFTEYLYEQRRKLDAAKAKALEDEEKFRVEEEERVANLNRKLQGIMGLTEEEASYLIVPKQMESLADFSVSEKVFGGVILPEEREGEE